MIKIPFGLNGNKILVHVDEVEKGKKCNCFCPSCDSPLVAVKGEIRQHHFRHLVEKRCSDAFARSIQAAVQKLMLERKQIKIPEYVVKAVKFDSKGKMHAKEEAIIPNGKVLQFDSVCIDKSINGINVDVLANKGERQLIIKITCGRKNKYENIENLKKLNISILEIDMSHLTQKEDINWEALWLRINDQQFVKWLQHAGALVQKEKLEKELDDEIRKVEEKYRQEKNIKFPIVNIRPELIHSPSKIPDSSESPIITEEVRELLRNVGLEAAQKFSRKKY